MAEETERGYFAERLKQLRAEAGLSQPALAAAAGVAVSTLRQFEYGRREPTYGTLVKLATGLGMSLSAFDPPQLTPTAGRPKKADLRPTAETRKGNAK